MPTKPAKKSTLKPSVTRVFELAVNLDDVTGQTLGDAQEQLLAAGALDVWTVAIGMKKQRPGTMLCLLCTARDRTRLAELVIRLTGSFGVRMREWDRLVLERKHQTVDTAMGPVRIKVGSLHGKIVVAHPEYEDVKTLATQHGLPLRHVMDVARAEAVKLVTRR